MFCSRNPVKKEPKDNGVRASQNTNSNKMDHLGTSKDNEQVLKDSEVRVSQKTTSKTRDKQGLLVAVETPQVQEREKKNV